MFPRVKLKKSSQSLLVIASTSFSIGQVQAQEITGQQVLPPIVTGTEAVADSPGMTRGLPNVVTEPDPAKPGSSTSEIEIANLEQRFFDHDFHSDSLTERLSRLEQLIFGSETAGNIDQRLAGLRAAADKKEVEDKSAAAAIPKKVAPEKETFNSVMSNGIAEYNLMRYHHAQEEFEKAIKLNPLSPEAYANLGGVFLMLRDKDNAKEAFKACFSLHPFGKIGEYAKQKILKIAEEEAYAKTNPQDSQKTVNRTIALIDQQSGDRARTYQNDATRVAQYRIDLANRQIQKLTNDPFYGIARNHHYNNGYFGDVSDWNYIKTNYLRTDGMVQANMAVIDGNNKASSVINSGANLKDQLLQPKTSTDGVRLRALGTSLYARYYGDGLPSTVDPPAIDPALPALQATAIGINKK